VKRFRRLAAWLLCAIFWISCFPAAAYAEEEPTLPTDGEHPVQETTPEIRDARGFQLVFSGETKPGSTLYFRTEPALENVIYAIRTGLEEEWFVLEGDCYTIPDGAPGQYTLWVTAVWEDTAADNLLELTYTIETQPEENEPEETQPEENEPEETQPEETEPEETEPEETEPEETEPEETEPEETEPEENEPEETEPEETETEETEPEETEPEETESEESQPEEIEPEETESEESQPEEIEPEETEPEETQPEAPSSGPGLYFGQLHAHTALSGGTGTVEEAFAYAAGVPELDFFAVTDHSHTFDHGDQGAISEDAAAVSEAWAQGKAAAAAVTDAGFVGIFGYEMSWSAQSKLGHISTFNTPGFQTRDQDAFAGQDSALESYYDTLAAQPGSISQFNHPGNHYGTFSDFAYCEEADRVISLLEVSSGGDTAFDVYARALDKGWHVAPTANQANYSGYWGDASDDRTVIYARSLTEADLYAAMREHRVYATQDRDLEILYSMDGHFMGSILPRRQIGETADISVTLRDPTDSVVGLVEVITCGEVSIGSATVEGSSETVAFSISPEYPYYYLRITQPDGDIAVTAPIWVEQTEHLGIRRLTCETAVPVQNQPVKLSLELYNQETSDFAVEKLLILAEGEVIAEDDSLTAVKSGETLNHVITVSMDTIGHTTLQVRLLGTLDGVSRSFEKEITLFFRRSQEVSDILLDVSHGNSGLSELTALRALAAEEGIRLTTITEPVSAEVLKASRLLIVTAPKKPFGDGFLAAVLEFVSYGGSVAICGQAGNPEGNARLNQLLSAIGSTMRIGDTASGSGFPVLLTEFQTTSEWCRTVDSGQKYRMVTGCAIDPGQGEWLVRGRALSGGGVGTTVLACEDTAAGGTFFAAGSLFFRDDCIREPDNIWQLPYANRMIAQSILGIAGEPLPLSTIRQAREDTTGQLVRIRGYVTAGTSNPYNTFPDTLYLQDDTGGIAVTPFHIPGIAPGTPLEITGYPDMEQGNRILNPVSHKVLDSAAYRYPAKTEKWDTLLDGEAHGGEYVQVEGTCTEIQLRGDGTLARFTVKSGSGTAEVVIGDTIFSGADGKNDLHKTVRTGRTIRAMGIVHGEESGETVIRVRNCEEVVYVPPRTEIPRTGDGILAACGTVAASFLGLLILAAGRKQRK